MPISEGSFVWHDLATTDVEGAKAFYPKVLPWTTQPWEDARSYTMWMNDGAPIGGVIPLSAARIAGGETPHWLPFVYVYDVDACTRQAAKIGGSVRKPPKEVPNAGCWSVIADPFGATIGLFEPAQVPPDRLGPPRRGEFSWHELATDDYRRAFDFYAKLFRWEPTGEHDMGAEGVYYMFGQKGRAYGGLFNRAPDMPPPRWLSYARVDDVKHAADAVKANGGQVHRGPMEVPGGDSIAICVDPSNATFALHQTTV
jgi:predicted enzyme related to lactoylglutathione lyase